MTDSKKMASRLEDHAGYWLRYVSNHVSHAFAQKVEAKGVTVAEWVVLRAMHGAKTVHPSQLAETVGMTRGAISKLVDRLSQKDLISRDSVSRDQRFQTLELTAAAKRLIPKLAKLADENDAEFFGHLNSEDRLQLVGMLQDIVRRHGWKEMPVK